MAKLTADEVRARVRGWLEGRPDVTPAALGNHTVLAGSTCRHFLDGSLRWGTEHAASEFLRVVKLAEGGDIFPVGAEPVAITEGHAERVPRVKRSKDSYITETVKRVGQTLDYCAEYAAIGVITGDYGVGKTMAVELWRAGAGKEVESVVYEFDEFTARNAVAFVDSLGKVLGAEATARGARNGHAMFEAVCARLKEEPVMLILDQCESVAPRVIQVVRQIWDRTGVAVVLLAAPVLMERLMAARIRDLGALSSRVGKWTQLRGLSQAEMQKILEFEGIGVDAAVAKLWWQAVGGSMRRLMRSIDLIKARHAGKAISEKTLIGVAAHLWGMELEAA